MIGSLYVEKYYHNGIKYSYGDMLAINMNVDYSNEMSESFPQYIVSTEEINRYLTFFPEIDLEPLGKLRIIGYTTESKKKIILTFWSTIIIDKGLKLIPDSQRNSRENIYTISIEDK